MDIRKSLIFSLLLSLVVNVFPSHMSLSHYILLFDLTPLTLLRKIAQQVIVFYESAPCYTNFHYCKIIFQRGFLWTCPLYIHFKTFPTSSINYFLHVGLRIPTLSQTSLVKLVRSIYIKISRIE